MSWTDGLRHRVRVWWDPRGYARERDRELRFHEGMEDEARQAGGPPLEELEPGEPGRSPTDEEGSMGRRWWDAVRQDVGYGVRGLVRAPGFTALAVATLALGLGANAAVFSMLDRLFGQTPPGLEAPETLRRLYIRFPDHPITPGMVFPHWNYPSFVAVDDAIEPAGRMAAWTSSTSADLRAGTAEIPARRSYVTHDFFDVLGVESARGRTFGEDEASIDRPSSVAVITDAFWERGFAREPEALGQTLTLDDTLAVTIVGILEPGFSGLDLSYTDIFLPANIFPAQSQLGLPWYEWTGNYFRAVVRIPEDGPVGSLEDRASAGYQHAVLPEDRRPDSTAVVLAGSIIETRGLGMEAGTGSRNQAVAVSVRVAGVSLLVLLIACANVAGLLLVRAVRRRREIAVRRALGVSRGRLARQFLLEGALLAVVAGGVAVLVAAWGGVALRRLLMPEVHWASAVLDSRTLAFALASSLAIGLLAAVAPAVHSARGDVLSGLKIGATDGGSGASRFRLGLLALQVSLSVVLLVGAGLFVRSLNNVASIRLGFDVEELAWVRPGEAALAQAGSIEEVAARVASVPGVADVSLASMPPMLGASFQGLHLPGRDSLPPMPPQAYPALTTVDAHYFDVTGRRIIEGRAFEEGEAGVAVVSVDMARLFWPDQSALGQCFIVGEPDALCVEVVGVSEGSPRRSVTEDGPELGYFLPHGPDAQGGTVLFRAAPRQWSSVVSRLRQDLFPGLEERDLVIGRMSDALEPQFRPWRLGAQLFTLFGLLALVVTMVGTYSVLAYAVSQRTQEIGIRMALGACMADVLRLIVGSGLKVIVLGTLAGILAALALGRLVESLLYDVPPSDPLAMTAAAAVLLVTGTVASMVPAWRAGRVDPAKTLRED